MGMFDISGTGSRAKPMYAEDLYAAGQNMFADQMAPGIKRMTGYESPKRKAMAIAGKANLNSMSSIQDTHKQLQQINAEMANAWLKQSLESYNSRTQRMTAENSRLASMSKAPAKRETKFNQVTGQLQYVDNGQVVPGFEQIKTPTNDKNKALKSPTVQDITMIKEDIEEEYSSWFYDGGLFDETLPGGMTIDAMADFVFRYKQINPSETTFTVMEKIKKGLIDPNEIISISGGSTSSASPVIPSSKPLTRY